jgi:ATP-binding cassette subfamily B protein
VVDDEAVLFSVSVGENIAYGRPDATSQEIEKAAAVAAADRFIDALPQGYDTVVSERGSSLSGGERQRVAIARAVLTDPRILILDDATSSVDVKVERAVHDALRSVMRDRTTVVIAHRLSTITLADRVLFLDDGRIAAAGTHDELLKNQPRYREVLARAEEIEAGRMAAEVRASLPPGALETDQALDPLEQVLKGMS